MSNYIKATNFTAKDALPTGDSGKIVKGTEIDAEFVAIAAAIASKPDSNSPTLTGTPLAPTATAGTNDTQIATTAFVTTAVNSSFPVGAIVLWSGSVATIPTGWALCDGGTVGPLTTPDLRGMFIVGAGGTYAVGATGGSANAITVAHTHTATSTVTDPGHAHTYLKNTQGQYVGTGVLNTDVWNNQPATSSTASTGISVATTVASAGASGTDANLPPYYALCYIMKV